MISLHFFGLMMFEKSSLFASFSRLSVWLTLRSSPDRPTSPNIMDFFGRGFLKNDEAIAIRTARSAAGSDSRIPPTIFMKMS